MSTDAHAPVLLRRLARVESKLDRLVQDLGAMRAELQQRAAPPGPPTTSALLAAAAADGEPMVRGGLAAAQLRGEAARVQWVRDGLVVPAAQLAQAWGLTRQALAAAARRGEVFAITQGRKLYHPQAFLALDRAAVAQVCRALGTLEATEKLLFWLRGHGALQGRSVAEALAADGDAARVERLAQAWARERGAGRA